MRLILLSVLLLSIAVACNKPEPNPENQDKIYLDLQTELAETQKKATETESSLSDYKVKLKDVVPQTGQIHYIRKRVFESEKQLDKLNQQIKYWTLRLDSRKEFVRRKSLEAFYKGEKWSDEKEFEEYETQKRMFHARREWSGRERRESFLEEEAKAKKTGPEGAGGEGEKKGE